MGYLPPGHFAYKHWQLNAWTSRFIHWPGFPSGLLRKEIILKDLEDRKEPLNIFYVSKIEFGLLIESNSFLITSRKEIETIVSKVELKEVDNLSEAELILLLDE